LVDTAEEERAASDMVVLGFLDRVPVADCGDCGYGVDVEGAWDYIMTVATSRLIVIDTVAGNDLDVTGRTRWDL
jgi:hypothetical protein